MIEHLEDGVLETYREKLAGMLEQMPSGSLGLPARHRLLAIDNLLAREQDPNRTNTRTFTDLGEVALGVLTANDQNYLAFPSDHGNRVIVAGQLLGVDGDKYSFRRIADRHELREVLGAASEQGFKEFTYW